MSISIFMFYAYFACMKISAKELFIYTLTGILSQTKVTLEDMDKSI